MNDLHGEDILLWSERQAELLRRRGAGEPVNDADIDWHIMLPRRSRMWGVASCTRLNRC
jgi:hypothetical protein